MIAQFQVIYLKPSELTPNRILTFFQSKNISI